MDSLPMGSVQSGLGVAAQALGPLIALIVGFEGANWFLRRRLSNWSSSAGVRCSDRRNLTESSDPNAGIRGHFSANATSATLTKPT